MNLASIEPRATCPRCTRPPVLCWCAHLVSLETRTKVIVLQHPTERFRSIGTARMASLCLPNSELRVGVDFERSAELARALSDPERPAAVLYPGPGAIDIDLHPPRGPITLVVVDGTWHHAKKLLRTNARIRALPRYAFTPKAPSEYRIRREPKVSYVSTVEALAHVLGVLEGDPERFASMLVPFRAMIDAQIAYESATRTPRRRASVKVRAQKPTARSMLRARADDVVCVAGEANAWPGGAWADELVHLLAHRPSTGETFEAIVRPRHPLGPGTARQTRIDADRITSGEPLDEVLARWRTFVQDGDLVCSWGQHAISLLAGAGGALPEARVDLRRVARDESQGRAGLPLAYLARMAGAVEVPAPIGVGRAGIRLAEIVLVAKHLCTAPEPPRR